MYLEVDGRGWLMGDRDLYKWAATILTSRCFSSAAFAMTEGIQQYPTSPNAGYEGLKGPSVPSSCFPILLPVFDIANHNPAANVTWGRENSSCSFTTTQDIPAGKEICISYDNKSNEERKYVHAPLWYPLDAQLTENTSYIGIWL